MARTCRDDLPDGESEIFLREGLDRLMGDLPVRHNQRPVRQQDCRAHKAPLDCASVEYWPKCPSRPGSSSKIIFRPLTRRLCLPLKSRPIILVYWPISMRELRMSQVKRHMERNGGLHFQAIEVALQAKALKECSFPGHSDWVLDQGDNEANSLAFAIGTNRWESGEIA